jgi:hypothetical protein
MKDGQETRIGGRAERLWPVDGKKYRKWPRMGDWREMTRLSPTRSVSGALVSDALRLAANGFAAQLVVFMFMPSFYDTRMTVLGSGARKARGRWLHDPSLLRHDGPAGVSPRV